MTGDDPFCGAGVPVFERNRKMEGKIVVTVQEADRLAAITALSRAVENLAEALSVVPQVTITHCNFQGGDPAIMVDTSPEIMETTILKE